MLKINLIYISKIKLEKLKLLIISKLYGNTDDQ